MNKEFKIQDIFEKINTPKIKKKANDFPVKWTPENCIPLLTAGIQNQGFARFARKDDCPLIIKNCISVSANGANSGVTYYQPQSFAVLQDAYALKVKNHEISSIEEGLYLSGSLNKAIKSNHNWVNKAGWNNIKNDSFTLPVIKHADPNHKYTVDDIDWQYMEDRIKELEEDRIKELDAYLKATNLNDYELTDEDKKVLSLSRKSSPNKNDSLETDCQNGTLRFKKVRIGSLFDVHPTKSYKLKNRELFATGGNVPVLSNSSANNGIGGYCGLEPTEEGKIITFSDTTTGADTMFYQKEPFIGYPHVQGMYPYNSFVWNEKRYLYLISAIRKSAGNGWSYAVKFNRALVCELMVEFPVTADGEPDFDYMERYIRAIEKLTIADVVKYKDKVIDTTKMLVNSQS